MILSKIRICAKKTIKKQRQKFDTAVKLLYVALWKRPMEEKNIKIATYFLN